MSRAITIPGFDFSMNRCGRDLSGRTCATSLIVATSVTELFDGFANHRPAQSEKWIPKESVKRHEPQRIGFDCDGTLANTMPLHWLARGV